MELLKLPLAIWTASRVGWAKGFMLFAGLPLICVLTFQLVKDMAVYEMGTAMAPAGQLLEKGVAEETKIAQLNGDLAAIEQKKVNREQMLAELAAKQAKAKADLEDSLKRNEAVRQEGISLSEYQKKELSEVEIRQVAITKQVDADAAQITKTIADLRARRETELAAPPNGMPMTLALRMITRRSWLNTPTGKRLMKKTRQSTPLPTSSNAS